jgi:hypothetical protein
MRIWIQDANGCFYLIKVVSGVIVRNGTEVGDREGPWFVPMGTSYQGPIHLGAIIVWDMEASIPMMHACILHEYSKLISWIMFTVEYEPIWIDYCL